MKKPVVLGVLFILPLVVYLFFASGVTNFGRLPVLKENISWSIEETFPPLKGKISLLIFLGNAANENKGYLFNFNQKIYKRFSEFTDFQTILVSSEGQKEAVEAILSELAQISDTSRYINYTTTDTQIQSIFSSIGTHFSLDSNVSSPYVFIVDKNAALRGRLNDEDEGIKYGYDMRSVAELNNKMEDDMKVILAEYRLALKKNNAYSTEAK
jgi:hypothetical protein